MPGITLMWIWGSTMPFANVNGVNLHYFELGHGLPLVFIHPPIIDSLVFSYLVAELSQDFRTIVLDIQGHGESGFGREPLTYSTIANDVVGLLDWLVIPEAVICGYSTGGSVILETLLYHKERVRAAVLLGGFSEVRHLWLRGLVNLAIGFSNWWLKSILVFGVVLINANEFEYYRREYRRSLRGNPKKWAEYLTSSKTYNCTSQLREVTTPVLLLYGEKDTRFRSYARQIQAFLPNGDLQFVPGCGHQLPTKAYRQVSVQIQVFLDRWRKESPANHP